VVAFIRVNSIKKLRSDSLPERDILTRQGILKCELKEEIRSFAVDMAMIIVPLQKGAVMPGAM